MESVWRTPSKERRNAAESRPSVRSEGESVARRRRSIEAISTPQQAACTALSMRSIDGQRHMIQRKTLACDGDGWSSGVVLVVRWSEGH
jgi:hypothetical protein